MSGAGRLNDNAYIERFWRTLKYEGLFLGEFQTINEIKSAIREVITLYNKERLHQSLAYRSPQWVYDNWIEPQKGKKQELFATC